ncbi:MAG: hypothetical protein H0T73_14555 [Ardenticatenales bacterium]|nr:hypothetical protein [Ardenticatenales bacterium]
MAHHNNPFLTFLLCSLALLFGVVGQWLLAIRPDKGGLAALLFGVALVPIWLVWGGKPLTQGALPPPGNTPRLWAVLLALLGAMVAYLGAAHNTFTWWGVAAWVASVLLWLYGWRVEQGATVPVGEAEPWQRWQIAAFVTILLLATFFRFWRLDSLPPEMTSDHAEKLLDVLDVLEGQRPIFFIRNTGREPMQFYLTALLAGPLGLGLGYLALKVGTALIGWLTVPLTYGMARYGLGLSRSLSLLAMALLAASKWHTSITRVGLRFPYAPFGVALTLFFFYRAQRLGARRDWLLSGVALGVALYGYTAIRILPVLLLLGSLLWLLLEQVRGRTGLSWRGALLNVLLLPLTSLLVFLPLLRYSLEHPELFWYRSATRAIQGGQSDLMGVFAKNLYNLLLMFHVRGDMVWVNTLPLDPVLDRITGVFFILGAGIVLWVALRQPRAVDWTLLLSLPILLLPSALALSYPRENPSVVRTGGALPVIMIMAALPLHCWLTSLRWALPDLRGALGNVQERLPVAFAVVVLAVVAFLNGRIYFGPYAATYDKYSWNSSEVAQAIQAHAVQIGGVDHAFIESWPHWVDTRNVAISMGQPRWDSVLHNAASVLNTSALPAEPRLVILHPADKKSLEILQLIWETPQIKHFQSRIPGKEFIIVIHPDYASP